MTSKVVFDNDQFFKNINPALICFISKNDVCIVDQMFFVTIQGHPQSFIDPSNFIFCVSDLCNAETSPIMLMKVTDGVNQISYTAKTSTIMQYGTIAGENNIYLPLQYWSIYGEYVNRIHPQIIMQDRCGYPYSSIPR